jgi:hypothetical protein
MDEFSFSETRYINAHIDYGERIRSSTLAHRLHRLPNNRLRIYHKSPEHGALTIDEPREYPVRIVATDAAGNRSALEFVIQGRKQALEMDSTAKEIIPMDYAKTNRFQDGPLRVEIPAYALYQDLEFTADSSPAARGTLTPFYRIATEEVPVHLPYTLSIECPRIDASLRNKLLLVSQDKKGKMVAAGGNYQEGAVVAKLRQFGNYAVALDTLAPEIIPLGAASGDCTAKTGLRFTIRDDLSGIAGYEGYIDGNWALFEYDPKNERLSYTFDKQYITPDSEHELELYVSDEKGNANLFHSTFTW